MTTYMELSADTTESAVTESRQKQRTNFIKINR